MLRFVMLLRKPRFKGISIRSVIDALALRVDQLFPYAIVGLILYCSSKLAKRGPLFVKMSDNRIMAYVFLSTSLLLSVALVYQNRREMNRSPRWTLFVVGIIVWTSGAAVSGFLHPPALFSTNTFLPYAFAISIVAFLFLGKTSQFAKSKAIVLATVFCGVTVILEGMGVFFSPPGFRPGGILGNRNFAGEFLALSLPLLLATKGRWLQLCIGLVVFAIVWTRCRTAWIAGTVGISVYFLITFYWLRLVPRLSILVIIVGVMLAAIVPNRLIWAESKPLLSSLLRVGDLDEGSGSLRWKQYELTLRSLRIQENAILLGVGPGRWRLTTRPLNRASAINVVPHSDFLRTISDSGILGLVGMLALLVGAILCALKIRDAGTLGVLSALIVTMTADVPLYRLDCLAVFVFTVSRLVIVSQTCPSAGPPPPQPNLTDDPGVKIPG